ncbi:MAG: ankyrin repeat domain-containing protein [bacterium]|nr:ankyrin repeat domain-containing protein [bacterium]
MSKKKSQNMAPDITPFPSIGEIFQFIVNAFDLTGFIDDPDEKKTFRKKLERFAKEKEFDVEESNQFINDILHELLDKQAISNNTLAFITYCTTIFFDYYKTLITTIDSGFADRKDILIILFDTIFGYFISIILTYILEPGQQEGIIIPEKKNWIYSVKEGDSWISPIGNVFDWWVNAAGVESLKKLSSLIANSEKYEGYDEDHDYLFYKKYHRWKNNQHLPRTSSLIEILETSFDIGDNEPTLRKSLFVCLLFARASQYSFNRLSHAMLPEERDTIISSIQKIYSFLLKCNKKNEKKWIQNIYNEIDYQIDEIEDKKEVPQKETLVISNELSRLTDPLTQKGKDNDEKVKILLNKLSKRHPFNDSLYYEIIWREARYNALLNNHKKALELYKKAFFFGKYRAGSVLKEIIREGITLAAYRNKIEVFKLMYKWARLYELFQDDYDTVKEWIMDHQRKQFYSIFPVKGYYKSAPGTEKMQKESIDNIMTYVSDWKKRKSDLKNPNRKIKGFGPRRHTQLMISASLGEIDKIRELLKAGADPEIKASDGSTALISALDGKQKETALLLLDQNLDKSINARSKKERRTALAGAIDLADDELVRAVVNAGADISQRCGKDHEHGLSPLYYTINKIGFALFPEMINNAGRSDKLKAAGTIDPIKYSTKSVFTDELNETLEEITQLPIYENVVKTIMGVETGNLSDCYKVLDVLLENCSKKDTNDKHDHDITPFLFSAEMGDLRTFKALFEKGGDLELTNVNNATAFSISLYYRKYKIANFIMDNCDTAPFINTRMLATGHAPVHIAVLNSIDEKSQEAYNVLEKLLFFKPELSVKDNDGKSSFDIAKESGDSRVIDMLIDAGAGNRSPSGIIY